MKTKFIFLFLSLAVVCHGQSWLKLYTFNLEDVRQISDSIALNARDAFTFKSGEVPLDNRIYYVITYLNAADQSDSIVVMFRINYIGGTGDATNPGTPQYSYTKTTGKFTNLFPFWVKYMKPAAIEATVLEKAKDEATVKGATYDFHTEAARWTIEKF
jgi:hypothetical protein